MFLFFISFLRYDDKIFQGNTTETIWSYQMMIFMSIDEKCLALHMAEKMLKQQLLHFPVAVLCEKGEPAQVLIKLLARLIEFYAKFLEANSVPGNYMAKRDLATILISPSTRLSTFVNAISKFLFKFIMSVD